MESFLLVLETSDRESGICEGVLLAHCWQRLLMWGWLIASVATVHLRWGSELLGSNLEFDNKFGIEILVPRHNHIYCLTEMRQRMRSDKEKVCQIDF